MQMARRLAKRNAEENLTILEEQRQQPVRLYPIRQPRESQMGKQEGEARPEPPVAEPTRTANCVETKVIASVALSTANVPAEAIVHISTWRTVTEALGPVDRQALVKAKAKVIDMVTVTGACQGQEATLPVKTKNRMQILLVGQMQEW